jgi:hypothetical protein
LSPTCVGLGVWVRTRAVIAEAADSERRLADIR